MLSRVANNIFWMSRYIERTNGMLRLLRTNYVSSQDEGNNFSWKSVLRLYSDVSPEQTEMIENYSPRVLDHLVLDVNNTSSVSNNIYRARENARAVQDHISKEVWQCLNDYHHLVRDQQIHNQIKYGDPVTAFDSLIRHGMLYYGTVDSTMSRGEGYNYLHIGRFLERAILSIDMLNARLTELGYNLQQPVEAPALRYLLYSLSGYELYLKTYRGKIQTDYVVEQILYNTDFSHSVLYCLEQLSRFFERLKTESLPENYREVEFQIGKSRNNIRYSNMQQADSVNLKQFLKQSRTEIFNIASTINRYYFGNG
ncbi:MAG TPA: alpha-E domain-containing protein [Chitinophagaceae bacterium]|nr:alpha-E domain-containing protein [Chitinophagaceae bacterium]